MDLGRQGRMMRIFEPQSYWARKPWTTRSTRSTRDSFFFLTRALRHVAEASSRVKLSACGRVMEP